MSGDTDKVAKIARIHEAGCTITAHGVCTCPASPAQPSSAPDAIPPSAEEAPQSPVPPKVPAEPPPSLSPSSSLVILPGGKNGSSPSSSPAAAVKPERDSAAMIEARRKLWAVAIAADQEIVECEAALRLFPKRDPNQPDLARFLARLMGMRDQARALHAACYVNTIGERYDALQPLAIDAMAAAKRAGVQVRPV
jgi:hypothetical protein